MNPLDGTVEVLPGPLGAGAAGEEGAAGDEDDGAALDVEDDALCEGVGEGEAEPVVTMDGGAEADGGSPADDVLAACVPHAARVAPVSATRAAAAAFFALSNATADPSNGSPAGMPVQR
ncbi:hypothetical protein [Streptomyces sp. GS7]|uniref:hypothetical protein n=1 Tax=Streptomyces sp. GS7 TaxID=2692234 RepID=UPI001318CED0|nr:hypothetical protein [Streptomyces sp. GS7]QHC23206.1 hypothetical protein GR130_19125 [Streptomyces sp. GS7]